MTAFEQLQSYLEIYEYSAKQYFNKKNKSKTLFHLSVDEFLLYCLLFETFKKDKWRNFQV